MPRRYALARRRPGGRMPVLLAGYVLDERPGSADDHVFLRSVAPHVRLAGHASVHRVIGAEPSRDRAVHHGGSSIPDSPPAQQHVRADAGWAANEESGTW
jgi:hypothetical protein